MKESQQIIGEATRIEYSEKDGKLYLVFEITDPKSKLDIKTNWAKDIEYLIVDKKLIKNE